MRSGTIQVLLLVVLALAVMSCDRNQGGDASHSAAGKTTIEGVVAVGWEYGGAGPCVSLSTPGGLYWLRFPPGTTTPDLVSLDIYRVKGVVGETTKSGDRWFDVHSLKFVKRFTPTDQQLLLRATANDYQAIRALLAAGADPDVRSDRSDTPLIEVLSSPKQGETLLDPSEVVELLIEHGADVNARSDWGWSALHGAASFGLVNVARTLLEHGATVDAKTSDGTTPLHIAAMRGDQSTEVAILLIARGADPIQRGKDGKTALELANVRTRTLMEEAWKGREKR